MTLATNGPVYIQGTYNAPDGVGDSTTPGNTVTFGKSAGAEVPASIAADAITILSDQWDNKLSRRPQGERKPKDTVVSAAFITGNVPTPKTVASSKDRFYSGGVENFPRFLENWGGDGDVPGFHDHALPQ